MTEALVNVIIPVYNGALYVASAIHSVLAQTYSHFEIIVVDDGSTDGTAGQIKAISSPKIKYVFQPNAGASAARNRGVQLSAGAFLAFLDSDDLWQPDKLALQLDFLERHDDIEIIFGHYAEFVSPELPGGDAPEPAGGSDARPGYSSGTMLIRRDSFIQVGNFATQWRVGEFIDWYARAIDVGLRSAMIPQIVLRRRLHNTNSGIRQRHARSDYAHIVRNIVERRRQNGAM